MMTRFLLRRYEMMTLEFLWEKKGLLAALVKTKPLKVYPTQSVFEAVLQKSIPTRIHQFMLCIDNSEG